MAELEEVIVSIFFTYILGDIQPTQPGRALPMPQANTRAALDEPLREEPIREENRRNEVRHVERADPQMQFRYEPRRGDGNFRNRNVHNTMPQAG